ncbi:heterokaryon incompatibility protein-domain-containing protein [Xylariaceae sp. FL0016]|nr:heterokaryon incompatibility protein-domain-containing protein [Xylariaceae sp. FL0016]
MSSNVQQPRDAKYCAACSRLTLDDLRQPDGFSHLPNARGIISSAKQCDLCNLIRLALVQDKLGPAAEDQLEASLSRRPVILYGARAQADDDEGSDGPLVGIDVHVYTDVEVSTGDTLDIAYLSLVAPRKSAPVLSGEIGGLPLLQDAGGPEAFDILRSWLGDCKANHPQCRSAFSAGSAAVPALPTRVIDVGCEQPRLFLANGTSAPYAALSHCWGKIEIRRTLQDNVHDHIESIPVEQLPKTFQDAIKITREVGLRYLWIDSLCIVQDDPEDWKREALVMGRVYRDAEITIAATGAEDGRQGCFIPRPAPLAMPVALPNIGASSSRDAIYAGLSPDQVTCSIDQAPLNERAWITQEWMLSPRVVHYTAARMLWACKTSMISEDGQMVPETDEQFLIRGMEDSRARRDTSGQASGEASLDSRLSFYSSWCDFVSTYTGRKLTYETDKSIALAGLAQEVQSLAGHRYIAGMFCGETRVGAHSPTRNREEERRHVLALQLCWYAKGEMTRPVPLRRQPSWSWLSTIGPVAHHVPSRSARLLARTLSITAQAPPGSDARLLHGEDPGLWLELLAPLARIDRALFGPRPGHVPEWAKAKVQPFSRYCSHTSFLVGTMVFPHEQYALVDETGDPLGWACFDEARVPRTEIYGIALSENGHGGEFDGYNVLFLIRLPPPAERHGDQNSRSMRLSRVGMGEVLSKSRFDETMMTCVHVY